MADFVKRGRNWYYRYTDADGRRVMRKGCPDRRVTEDLARARALWDRLPAGAARGAGPPTPGGGGTGP